VVLLVLGGAISVLLIEGIVDVCAQQTPDIPSSLPSVPAKFPQSADDLARIARKKGLIAHPKIPVAADVKRMTAEGYNHFFYPNVPNIDPFDVPPEYYEELLRFFRNAELDEDVPSVRSFELGSLRILTKDGETIRICWFWAGQYSRLEFSWKGIRYRSKGNPFSDDETVTVDIKVREIHERIKTPECKPNKNTSKADDSCTASDAYTDKLSEDKKVEDKKVSATKIGKNRATW